MITAAWRIAYGAVSGVESKVRQKRTFFMLDPAARLAQARGLGLACQAILTFRCCATQSRRYRLMRLW